MMDRDEGKRAAEEAESLLTGERVEEVRSHNVVLLDREAAAVLEVLSHVKASHFVRFVMGKVNESQTVEDSSAVLLGKLQRSKTGAYFDGSVEIETSYAEVDGFSRELKEALDPVVSLAKTFGASEPLTYVAQIPLILNNAVIAAGGKGNPELREYWERFVS